MILNAKTLSLFIESLAKAPSIKQAWEATGSKLSLNTAYRLRKRLDLQLSRLRSILAPSAKPPPSKSSSPLLQTWLHLNAIVGEPNPIKAFQLRFQKPFFPN
jgi:hypothetical protein